MENKFLFSFGTDIWHSFRDIAKKCEILTDLSSSRATYRGWGEGFSLLYLLDQPQHVPGIKPFIPIFFFKTLENSLLLLFVMEFFYLNFIKIIL